MTIPEMEALGMVRNAQGYWTTGAMATRAVVAHRQKHA